MILDPLTYRIAFASMRGLTPRMARQLLGVLDSEEHFFTASERELAIVTGGRNRIFDRELRNRFLTEASRELNFVKAHNIATTYFTDPAYPRRLLEADDAPLMFYSLGPADLSPQAVISVVGTRHATSYGVEFTERLIRELAANLPFKPLIVSSLAFGIDITAHRAALENSLPTAAVLAHGLNTLYPSQHRAIASRIISSGGALITDYRSVDTLHKGNFLARNRIVAGLCDCLIVVESASKGGALVTAKIASCYNREVFALPGRISDRYSQGCNNLCARQLAHVITSPDDLIEAMGWPRKEVKAEQPSLFSDLNSVETLIVDYLLSHDSGRVNELAVKLNLPAGKVMSILVDLEFRGIVTAIPGGAYRCVSSN